MPIQSFCVTVNGSGNYQDTGQDIGDNLLLGVAFSNADPTNAARLSVTGGSARGSDGTPRALCVLGPNSSHSIDIPGGGMDLTSGQQAAVGIIFGQVAPITIPTGPHIWVASNASVAYITIYFGKPSKP